MTDTALPPWTSVLAVVAHPDDESFGLGAVLSTFVGSGARVFVVCFTRGEASTLHPGPGDLAAVRAEELRVAARELGVSDVHLMAHPDGFLSDVPLDILVGETLRVAARVKPDGLVAFDAAGVTGHPDHQHATAAATRAAAELGVGILGWTVPADVAETLNAEYGSAFTGHEPSEIDLIVDVDRARQYRAVVCHPSQAVPGSVMWRRLDLLASGEHLRWLHQPAPPNHESRRTPCEY